MSKYLEKSRSSSSTFVLKGGPSSSGRFVKKMPSSWPDCFNESDALEI